MSLPFSVITQLAVVLTGVTAEELTSRSKATRLTKARHLLAYLCRAHGGMTYQQIADAMNRADHTTAMHAVRKVSAAITTDGEAVDALREKAGATR